MYCSKMFTTAVSTEAHMKKIHGHTFNCLECGKIFLTKAALRSHCDTHNNNKPYSCDECSTSFSTQQYYMKTLETHKTCIQFTCPICDTVFQSRSIFNRHSKQHYIDHVSLVRQLVFELVDSVVPVKCNNH